MEGLLLGAVSVAVLVGLGGLVSAARPRLGRDGQRRQTPSWLVRAIPTGTARRE